MTQRQNRVQEQLQHLAAEYIGIESNRTSLITVTHASISDDLKRATIFVTVFPEEKERGALDFLNRKKKGFRLYIKSRANLKYLPVPVFKIDEGEKHRQHIDGLVAKG